MLEYFSGRLVCGALVVGYLFAANGGRVAHPTLARAWSVHQRLAHGRA